MFTPEENEYPYRIDMAGDTRFTDWHSEARQILEDKKRTMLKFSLTPGRVRINCESGIRMVVDTEDAKIFLVDMNSKYGGFVATSVGPDNKIGLHIYPGESTIHLDESTQRDTILWVEGLQDEEWVDIAVWRRYTLYVSLFRSRISEEDNLYSLEVLDGN